MYLTTLQAKNFRNLNLDLSLANGINLIVGENGRGKSNFLDAVYVLANASSFRNSKDVDNINWEAELEFYTLGSKLIFNDADSDLTKLEIKLGKASNRIKRQLLVNSKAVSRQKYTQNFKVLFFSPKEVSVVAEGPEIRRSLLDSFISTVDAAHTENISDYNKVLKSRNKILKQIRAGEASERELGFWDEKLVDLGSRILAERKEVINKVFEHYKEVVDKVFTLKSEDLKLVYSSKVLDSLGSVVVLDEIKQAFELKLVSNRDKEILAAQSLYGPHRDDLRFEFLIKGSWRNLRDFGSRGQNRVISLLLMLSFREFALTLKKPVNHILLLDDIMSELDSHHTKNLERYLLDCKTQTFLASVSEQDFSKEFVEKANVIPV